jgi:hypothetical protein
MWTLFKCDLMLLEGAYGIKLYNVVGMGVGNHGRRDEI